MTETLEVTVRKATQEDIPSIARLVDELHRESLHEFGTDLDISTVVRNIKLRMSAPNQVVFVSEDEQGVSGSVMGYLAPSVLNDKQLVAAETFWYVSKGRRRKQTGVELLKAFESWSIDIGAHKTVMTHMANLFPENIAKLYERSGYKLMELQYVKEVSNG